MEIDYEKIHRQATRYAKRHGHPNDAEDFAQECCLYSFEKRTDAVFIARRFSDYLRRNYGDARKPGGSARREGIRHAEQYDEEAHGAESPDGRDFGRVGIYLSKLSRYERLIYVLRHKYEVPVTQIADSQGVSESRISQVLSGIQKAVYKEAQRAESRISRTGEEEMEAILRAQRERLERGESDGVEGFESFAVESFNASGL